MAWTDSIQPDYVRAGYSYFPQKPRDHEHIGHTRALASTETIPQVNDPEKGSPTAAGTCLTPLSRARWIEPLHDDRLPAHAAGSSSSCPSRRRGSRAGFADGHVAWQNAKAIPAAFNQTTWASAGVDGGTDAWRYIASLFQP